MAGKGRFCVGCCPLRCSKQIYLPLTGYSLLNLPTLPALSAAKVAAMQSQYLGLELLRAAVVVDYVIGPCQSL